jgi:two-component system response regulator PilR (NtrC family)
LSGERAKILVVDDEQSMREFLEMFLRGEGYEVRCASSGGEADGILSAEAFDLVITDIIMKGGDGMQVLRRAREADPETAVVMITAYASTETAIEALKYGAHDYIIKPFKVDEMRVVVRNAVEKRLIKRENVQLKRELKKIYSFGNIIGSSPGMLRMYELIRQVADSRTNVLVTGESGTGKELVAKAIHYNSARKELPFLAVNCGAIPENLLESELFGHVKGAFTGAVSSKPGLFEAADGGTLLLDEITEMPTQMQVKLLRVIEERNLRRVGAVHDVAVDVRLIAASNRNIEDEVRKGRLREDIYFRLNVIHIMIPPLRERKDDIPSLARHFLEKYCMELKKEIRKISEEALARMMNHDYPGNVRELENIIERAVTIEKSGNIMPESLVFGASSLLSPAIQAPSSSEDGTHLERELDNMEREMIQEALRKAGGIKTKAAELLNVSFRSFRYRLKRLGME